MFTPWFDIDATFAEMETARRQMEALLSLAMSPNQSGGGALGWADVKEEGDGYKLTADLPGLKAADLNLSVHGGELTLSAERRLTVPEGFQPRRQERRAWRLNRTVSLPKTVDAEKITAELTNGVLTVHLPKQPEVQPRAISIQSA
jgi:HSP20 family protein